MPCDLSTSAELRCVGCGAPLERRPGRGRQRKWCSNRCRRHTSYGGKCLDCGKPTYGGDATPPERCVACTAARRKFWTREALIATIQAWAREHGGIPPVASDWNPPHAIAMGHPEKAAKFYEDNAWPHVSAVQEEFGSWTAGLEAAGFISFSVGRYGRDGEDLKLCREIAERYAAGESSTDLAREYDCTYTAILYRVRKAGGEIRDAIDAQRASRERRAAA